MDALNPFAKVLKTYFMNTHVFKLSSSPLMKLNFREHQSGDDLWLWLESYCRLQSLHVEYLLTVELTNMVCVYIYTFLYFFLVRDGEWAGWLLYIEVVFIKLLKQN